MTLFLPEKTGSDKQNYKYLGKTHLPVTLIVTLEKVLMGFVTFCNPALLLNAGIKVLEYVVDIKSLD